MREIFQKLKIPLIALAIIFAGFIVYNMFVKAPQSSTLLKSTSQIGRAGPESNFLPILIEIQGVTLDEKLFLDPVFRALVNWSQPIVPESIGKQNPFSGATGSAQNSSVESLGFTDSAGTSTSPATSKTTTTVKKK